MFHIIYNSSVGLESFKLEVLFKPVSETMGNQKGSENVGGLEG